MNFQKLFENPFDDVHITGTRLGNFAVDTLEEFKQSDAAGKYKLLTDALQDATDPFLKELSGVDQNLGKQKGKTQAVLTTTKSFKKGMSELEGAIARAVGGFGSAAYLEFYPHGVTEYSTATKTKMPTLLSRVTAATTTYKKALGADLTAELLAFEASWSPANNDQAQVKSSVKTGRTDRTNARHAVELALLALLFTVAADHPGDVAGCMKYFNFGLLEGKGSGKKGQLTRDK